MKPNDDDQSSGVLPDRNDRSADNVEHSNAYEVALIDNRSSIDEGSLVIEDALVGELRI